MPIDINYFISELASLDIVSEQKLKPFIDKKSTYSTGEALAKDLIKTGLLTKYQAEQILSGKGKNLRMGKYLIETKLGAGGMGQVFKAQHSGMGRTVAIKVIHTKNRLDTQAIQRFDREVKAAARLIHPNVITVFDADHENGLHYMVMEYCEGKDLAALIRQQGTLGLKDAVDYITQAARGLQYAHEQGVIHRDIKPGNLLVDKSKKVKVVDMGLARLQSLNEEEKVPMLTATTAIMGTVDFMSPEQGLSTRQADARSDIYSLGASLYFLLTGKVMFEGETAFAKLIAHREEPIPALKLIRADIPDALETIYQKMVAKNVEDRYQTMTEVIAGLTNLNIVPESETINYSASTKLKRQEFKTTLKPAELGLTKVIKGKETSKEEPFKFNYKHLTYILGTLPILILMVWLLLPGKKIPLDVNPSQNILSQTTENEHENEVEPQKNTMKIKMKMKPEMAETETKIDPPKNTSPEKTTSLKKAVPDIASIDFEKENLFLIAPFSEAKAKEVQNALAKKLGISVETKIPLGNGVDLEMVLIPPGKFLMGSPDSEEGRNNNETLHEVMISKPFYMGKTEVTIQQWNSVMQTNSTADAEPLFPITNISILVASDFLKNLNQTNSQDGFSLPTEAEWEYACRAGTTSPFYFGNTISKSLSNYNSKSLTKVKSYPPNGFGLYDMHGNVSEWVSDFPAEYPKGFEKDPKGPYKNPSNHKGGFIPYVTRSGNYKNLEKDTRSASRGSGTAHSNNSGLGFRLKKTIKIVPETTAGKSTEQTKKESSVTKETDFEKEGLTLKVPFSEAKAKEVQNALARKLGITVERKIPLGNGVDLEMVLIPPGKFMMGSPDSEGGRDKNELIHEVTITKPFYMGKYEITRKQWHIVMSNSELLKKEEELFPALNVGRKECDNFVTNLNSLTNLKNQAFRMPTEAEWEFACRSGTNTSYFFGNEIDQNLASYDQSSIRTIGSFKPNAFGLYDMHGNASEWVADAFKPYTIFPSIDPFYPIKGTSAGETFGILRGGNYLNSKDKLRSAARFGYNSIRILSGQRNQFSFRIASSVETINSTQNTDFEKEGLTLDAPFSETKAKEIQNALAKKLETTVESKVSLWNGVTLDMVLIPPGKFRMGSTLKENDPDKFGMTPHEVILTKPYYIGKYEVNQEQWDLVMGTNPSISKGAKLPVHNISWGDCQMFITKLNSKTDGGYRLPTEAEWEFACRAGTTTAYSFGDKITPQDANYLDSKIGYPVNVESFKPNAFGLFNMHGNVTEWCQDWVANYNSENKIFDPKGPANGKWRVLRGGSWLDPALGLRSHNRINLSVAAEKLPHGFRLVKSN